jgi:1-acyl-sn-glycerol-3-phosphate acyltransferase
VNLSKKILQLFGWQAVFNTEIPQKCIICVAPHTSNWDFMLGMLFKSAYKIKVKFFIKEEWVKFPVGFLIIKLGGIPIKRHKQQSTTDIYAKEFARRKELKIAITPEGTRKLNQEWKLGFYYIARKANVPVLLAGIDYKTKRIVVGKQFFPTENAESDIAEIKAFYKDFSGKFPERFGC